MNFKEDEKAAQDFWMKHTKNVAHLPLHRRKTDVFDFLQVRCFSEHH